MGRLEGKIAFITGAGIGIGRAGAELFAREGAYVIVTDIAERAGAECAREIRHAGGRAEFIALDVSKADHVEAVLNRVMEHHNRLDILYNNAGGSSAKDGRATDVSIEEFWRVLNVDLFGTFLCCRLGIPLMMRGGGGVIVNTTSTVALRGVRKADAYTAAKGAILSLTYSLAANYAESNIRVNAIAPAGIMTERLRMRLAQVRGPGAENKKSGHLLGEGAPLDAAQAALFLASDEARYITGVVLPVDGGWSSMGPAV